jgi:hypothetical protein
MNASLRDCGSAATPSNASARRRVVRSNADRIGNYADPAAHLRRRGWQYGTSSLVRMSRIPSLAGESEPDHAV